MPRATIRSMNKFPMVKALMGAAMISGSPISKFSPSGLVKHAYDYQNQQLKNVVLAPSVFSFLLFLFSSTLDISLQQYHFLHCFTQAWGLFQHYACGISLPLGPRLVAARGALPMVANRDFCKRSSEGSSRTPGRTMYKGHGSYVVVKGARLTTKHCHGSLSALPFFTMKRRLQGICIIDCDAATLNAIFAYYSTLGPADVTTINTLPSLTHDSLFDVVLYRRRKKQVCLYSTLTRYRAFFTSELLW